MLVLLKIESLFAVTIYGIKLPGNCPNAPPTHKFYEGSVAPHRVVLGIPFSNGRSSNLFKEISATSAGTLLVAFAGNGWERVFGRTKIVFQLKYNNTFQAECNITLDKRNETYFIETKVGVRNEFGFIFLLSDLVRIWFVGCFVMFWSCVKLTEMDHDEALLILYQQIVSKDCRYQSIGFLKQSLNWTNQRYLSESLLKQINLAPGLLDGNNTINNNDLFACPKNTLKIADMSVIIVVFVPFLGLLVILLRYYCESRHLSNNRVGPYVN